MGLKIVEEQRPMNKLCGMHHLHFSRLHKSVVILLIISKWCDMIHQSTKLCLHSTSFQFSSRVTIPFLFSVWYIQYPLSFSPFSVSTGYVSPSFYFLTHFHVFLVCLFASGLIQSIHSKYKRYITYKRWLSKGNSRCVGKCSEKLYIHVYHAKLCIHVYHDKESILCSLRITFLRERKRLL